MLKSSKRIFSLVLCFSILFSVFAGMNISVGYAYTDSQGHWAESIINKWSDSGIISGDGNGEFRPDDYITRAEFVKVVVTAKQYVDLEYNKYTDVNENDWFYPVICMASAAGIINGYEDGSFAPNNFITREEASVVMGRAYDLNLTELNDQFLDSYSISSWARPYISAMSNNGIITGYEDGTFKPLNPISRAETIQILDRIDSFSKNNKNSNDIVVINPNNGPSNSSGGKVNGGGSGGSSGGGSSNIKDNYFKVIFNLNYEASMGTPHSQKVKKGEYVSEPDTPKRDGFSFIGWFKDANCTDKFDFSLEPVNSNLTLYAGWGKDGYYSITDITVDKNNLIANVEVSAQEDCNIALKVLTEDKKSILGNGYAAVQEGTEVSEVSVNITMQSSLPQYFVVAADLIDNSGQYLCNSFVCITYTQAYEEFLAKDINDFDGKTVLNFDEDDDMNFAVLNDEVKVIDSETSNTIDESKTNVENGIFVLNNTDNITRNLKDGDKVLIDYGIGYFVTVKDVSNKGDSIIIESDDDYTLSDYCDYIKVDMDVNADSSDIDMSEASDGFAICSKIRQLSNVPIIMLTARDSDSDYVSGLALGSDDYFTKPFRPLKLVMRVKAIFRRIDMEQQALKDDKITLGNLSLLSKQRSVLISENEIPLTLIEFEFLDFLFQNQHRAVSRDEILNQVWGYDSMVETRVTDDTVKRLRKKLSDYGSNVFIETVRGFGFKLKVNQL